MSFSDSQADFASLGGFELFWYYQLSSAELPRLSFTAPDAGLRSGKEPNECHLNMRVPVASCISRHPLDKQRYCINAR